MPLYELIDKDGRVHHIAVRSAQDAAKTAALYWPDQPEDPDGDGIGWRVRAVDGDFVHQRSDRGPVDIR